MLDSERGWPGFVLGRDASGAFKIDGKENACAPPTILNGGLLRRCLSSLGVVSCAADGLVLPSLVGG